MVGTYGIIGGYGSAAVKRLETKVLLKATEKELPAPPQLLTVDEPEPVLTTYNYAQDLSRLRSYLNRHATLLEEADEVFTLCNGLQFGKPLLKEAFRGKHVSLPKLTVKKVRKHNHRKPLTLTSNIAMRNDWYDCSDFDGITLVDPDLINAGMFAVDHHPKLELVVNAAKQFDCDSIILGGAELSWFADSLKDLVDVPVYDCLEVAAEYMTNRKEVDNATCLHHLG